MLSLQRSKKKGTVTRGEKEQAEYLAQTEEKIRFTGRTWKKLRTREKFKTGEEIATICSLFLCGKRMKIYWMRNWRGADVTAMDVYRERKSIIKWKRRGETEKLSGKKRE